MVNIVHESSVEYIDHMGSDLTVVNAARVSFDKQSSLEEDGSFKVGDERLIKYLASHNHWTPFSHVVIQLRMSTPIAVARQLDKHQVGFTKNEVSRRYVDSPPDFYMPKEWRKRAENKKQGSSDEILDLYSISNGLASLGLSVDMYISNAINLYDKLIEEGVAPEQARIILPQNMMTSWYWTSSLYGWARLANLRLKPDAQKETREVAEKISPIMEKICPVSWKYLVNENPA